MFREPIIAEHPKTGHTITLYTPDEAVKHGFNVSSIYSCVNMIQNKHKGYIFRIKSFKPVKRNYDYHRYS